MSIASGSSAGPTFDRTAYLMIGHGTESSPHTDTVPAGCTLVVKASVCEPTYTKFIDFIVDKNQEKFLDPVAYADQIIERYGPVAIYQEGDVYPNIKYKLIAHHDMDSMDPSSIMIMSSGVIQHPFNKRSEKFTNYKALKKNLGALAYIPLFYENSVYPTRREIQDKILDIEKAEKMSPGSLSVSGFIQTANKYKSCVISQKQLFDFVREGKFAPGAFYNFSCRSLSGSLKSKMIGRNQNTGRKMILPEHRLNFFKTNDNAARLAHIQELNELRTRQSLSNGSILYPMLRNKIHASYKSKNNSNTRRVLKQQIEESHVHRRPYIKMQYEKKTHENNDGSKKVGGRRRTRKSKK